MSFSDDAEQFIAADLNLYSNPLNRALGHKRNAGKGKTALTKTTSQDKKSTSPTAKSTKSGGTKTTPSSDKEMKRKESNVDEIADRTDTMIACDLNKYDSPMKELETKYE